MLSSFLLLNLENTGILIFYNFTTYGKVSLFVAS